MPPSGAAFAFPTCSSTLPVVKTYTQTATNMYTLQCIHADRFRMIFSLSYKDIIRERERGFSSLSRLWNVCIHTMAGHHRCHKFHAPQTWNRVSNRRVGRYKGKGNGQKLKIFESSLLLFATFDIETIQCTVQFLEMAAIVLSPNRRVLVQRCNNNHFPQKSIP